MQAAHDLGLHALDLRGEVRAPPVALERGADADDLVLQLVVREGRVRGHFCGHFCGWT